MQTGQVQFIGVCTLRYFAEHTGIEEGVALGWMKKGYLPTKRIGKYTLINLAQFKVELLESDINQTETEF